MKKSIVISGPPAVGKTTVAKKIAEEFDATYLSGGDILKEMAMEQGYNSAGNDWWDTREGLEFLDKRKQNPDFDRKLDVRLTELFMKGGVVITSYTLPWLVDGGVKIWLEGSHASSTERMQNRDNMSTKDAFNITKQRFDNNKELYKKIYDFDFGQDKSVFDVIVDTDGLTASQVIDSVIDLVRGKL